MRREHIQRRMRAAPWWVWSLVTGGPYAVVSFFRDYVGEDRAAGVAVVTALLKGLVFGLLLGPLLARTARRQHAATSHLSDDQLRTARRAVTRGSLPEDPQTRASATRLAELALGQLRRQRRLVLPVSVAFGLLSAWFAVTEGARWWVAVALFAALPVASELLQWHIHRRLSQLK